MAGSASPPNPADRSGQEKREPKKVLLRIDPAIHAAIAKWAADDLRSVNAQMEFALRAALKQTGRLP